MNPMRTLIASLAAWVVFPAITLSIGAHAWGAAIKGGGGPERAAVAVTYHEIRHRPWSAPQLSGWRPEEPFPAPLGPPPPVPRAGPWPMVPPPGAEPWATHAACQDQIDRGIAMATYLKSKLRLQPNQKDAWAKLEQAANPPIQQLYSVCDKLPIEAGTAPSLPEALDMAEQETSARLDLLRAVRGPISSLYELLTPEQRQVLQSPAPAFLPPPVPHHMLLQPPTGSRQL